MVTPSPVDDEPTSGSRQYSLRALFIAMTIMCIVLGMLRAAPYSLLLVVGAAMAFSLDRLEARWKAEGNTAKPFWYRVGRRLYFALSGLVHAAIVGVLFAVAVYNMLGTDVDVLRAAIVAGGLGGAIGIAYPDFVKRMSILF
jgi:hypothetical protein